MVSAIASNSNAISHLKIFFDDEKKYPDADVQQRLEEKSGVSPKQEFSLSRWLGSAIRAFCAVVIKPDFQIASMIRYKTARVKAENLQEPANQ